MKIIIFQEKHFNRNFIANEEDVDKVFLKVFKERLEDDQYELVDARLFMGFGSMILKGLKFNFRIRYGDKHIKKKI